MYVKYGFELHLYFEFLMEGGMRAVKENFYFWLNTCMYLLWLVSSVVLVVLLLVMLSFYIMDLISFKSYSKKSKISHNII
jgi:hypothetical protein